MRETFSSVMNFLIGIGLIFVGGLFFVLFAFVCLESYKQKLSDQVRNCLSGNFINTGYGITHYEFSENNETELVILIHGFSAPYYIWDPTFDALVNAGFRVLRYDLYGRGFSDRPKKQYNLDLFVEQLYQLTNRLGIRSPFHLVGLSYGGPICAEFINRNPKRVKTLTLIDPLVSIEPLTQNRLFQLPLLGELYMALYFAPIILSRSQPNDFFEPENFPGWENKFKEQMRYRGFNQAILSTYRNLTRLNPEKIYSEISTMGIPVQIIWGEEDQTIKYEEIQKIQALIPDSNFKKIENAGHIPHYEKPEITNEILIDFIKSK